MKRFIVELGVVPSALDPLVIYCDMGAIANAQEPRSHKGLKHIKLRYHSIREYIEDGKVKICKVHTDLNVADPLTKALPRAKHDQHQNAMGVRTDPSLAERARPQQPLPATTHLPAGAAPPRSTTTSPAPPPDAAPLATTAGRNCNVDEEDHQNHPQPKRNADLHPLLPSPPRPAGEAETKIYARRTSTTSPAPRPERGKEGEDEEALYTSATAAVFGDAIWAHTPNTRNLNYPRGQSRGSPPPRGAETAAGGRGEQQIRRRKTRPRSRLSFRLWELSQNTVHLTSRYTSIIHS
ncbi:hypothetical protein QYE76_062964 [Lolium multiflorum]|uniref:Uncharacterized protein n=1 Tax=Lolium multiflorum TaxID=4521 RepID=A0AAD8S4L2_LOLMU|nr:hypothetical protein QYE76_062964 [Lolium multiflorum]